MPQASSDFSNSSLVDAYQAPLPPKVATFPRNASNAESRMFGQISLLPSVSTLLNALGQQPSLGRSANPAILLFQSATAEALDCLCGQQITDEGVHAARKALRKARAALRMLRPLLNRDDCQAYNHALRDAGRRLSPARDARILLDTLDVVVDRNHDDAFVRHADEIAQFRCALEARLCEARDRISQLDERRHCVDLIEQSREWLEREVFAGSSTNASRETLLGIYGKACKTFVLSREMPTLESMHEWRKQTKCFRTAASILRTTEMPGLHRLEKRASDIAGWLGEDHDLAVLLGAVRASDQLSVQGARYLARQIENRRAKLQHKAFAEGEELFGQKRRTQLTSTEQQLAGHDAAASFASAPAPVHQVPDLDPAQEERWRQPPERGKSMHLS